MIKWVVYDILVKCSCKINIYLSVVYKVSKCSTMRHINNIKKFHYSIIDIGNLLSSPKTLFFLIHFIKCLMHIWESFYEYKVTILVALSLNYLFCDVQLHLFWVTKINEYMTANDYNYIFSIYSFNLILCSCVLYSRINK